MGISKSVRIGINAARIVRLQFARTNSPVIFCHPKAGKACHVLLKRSVLLKSRAQCLPNVGPAIA